MEFVLKPRSLLSRSSLPTELSPSCFPRFPVHPCRRFHLAPSQRSSPQAVSHGFPSIPVVAPSQRSPPQKLFPAVSRPSTLSSLPSRPLPTELSPSYFPRFPVRPSCRRFHLVPSQRRSPEAISHGFPSVHPVVASVSLRPRQSKLNENPRIGDAFGKNIYSTTIGSSTMHDKSLYYIMIYVEFIHSKAWHQIDIRNTSALTRNARNAFVSFLSFLLAAPGYPHAVPRCEASNFGTIPVAIYRPASPNVATSN